MVSDIKGRLLSDKIPEFDEGSLTLRDLYARVRRLTRDFLSYLEFYSDEIDINLIEADRNIFDAVVELYKGIFDIIFDYGYRLVNIIMVRC